MDEGRQGEELVEAVARNVCHVVAGGLFACDPGPVTDAMWDEARAEDKALFRQLARAIIPVVLEQAAGVAEGMMSLYPHKSRASDATSDFDKGAQQALYLSAQAIRSLASQGREG